jgi:glycosyltransferase involved in cell wall biosynthesis
VGQPRISVVTPSLNQGRFIERTINSVLDQGYPNLEYVIVDGGSTDETVKVIQRYENDLDWWVSERDEGQTEAINRGIEGTTGEIVAYLNSDDYYLPGAFAAAVAAFERTGCGWVAGAAKDLDENDEPAGTPGTDEFGVIRPTLPASWEHPPRGRQWWLFSPWHVPQPSAFWRRDLFDTHGLFRRDMHYAFDAEFMIRLALADEMPELLREEILAVRLRHSEAKSADYSHWAPEINHIVKLYSPILSPHERRRLPIVRLLTAVPVAGRASGVAGWAARVVARAMYATAACGRVVRRAYGRTVTKGGDMLEYVPERYRPPIRTRDRHKRRRRRD